MKETSQPLDPRSIPLNPVPLEPARPGSTCPGCGQGRLDYNGLLELECPLCGFTLGSGAGCT
jgi:uncharacterized protein (DUF983 family)